MAGRGEAWQGYTHSGEESPLQCGSAWPGRAWLGMARLHTLHPSGCRSVARLGQAGRGGAGRGVANTQHLHGVLKFADNQNKEKHMENTENNMEVLRLPLWKNCLDEMLHAGVEYGATYSADFFEERLKSKRDTMTYGLDISKIREGLLKYGFFLSGRGQKGEQFVILQASANSSVMENFQAQAIKALRSGVILGTNTRIDLLNDEERRKHEATLERLAVRTALVTRKLPVLKKALKSLAA